MKGSWGSTSSLILLIACCIAICNGQTNYVVSSVTVTKNPTDTLMIGSTNMITITCNVSITCSSASCMDDDNLTISWTLNGNSNTNGMISNTMYSMIEDTTYTSTLTTTGNISPNHAGVYRCTGMLDSGSTNSGTNTVNVQMPSPMVTVTSNITNVGGDTTLTCTPSVSGVSMSDVTYTYSWSPGSDTDNTLNINGVSVSNAGQYTCTVTASYTGSNSAYVTDSNGSGTGNITVNLPSPMVSVTSNITNVGGDTTLTCTPSVSGVSMSNVTYTYSWSPGSDTDDTLNINGVSVSNAGQYTCTVTASYTGSNSAYVTDSNGSGMGTITVNLPSPVVSVTSTITNVGGDTALTCTPSVSGVSMSDIDYTYSWSPGSDTDDTLNINGVSVSNAGQYTCTVTASYTGSNSAHVNIISPSQSGVGTLYVTATTVSPVSITRLTVSPYDVFDITCMVTLIPSGDITYTWMIPSGFTSSDTASSTLTATVNSTPNTYTVTCNTNVTVTGVDGMTIASDSGTIIVKGPSIPIKPVITAISVTPNDAMILWNVSEVTFTPETYVIECGVEMDNFNLTSPPVSTMNTDSRGFTTDNDIGYSQTITGLNIAITYFCRISSTNTNGTNYSDTFNFTTEETIPHAPNATLVAVSSTSLTLSWKEPKPFTGAITDYNYTCVNVNGSASYTSSDMTPNNPSLMNVTLTGLQPHREYTCNVTASTSKGVGAIGTVNGITNEAAPTGPPLSFIITSNNPNGFTLNWSPPDIQLRNGIIRSYFYNCNEVGSTTLIVPTTVTSDTTATVQMSIIKPYTNYNCSVYATTNIGPGPSTSTIGTTAEDIPSEIISLVVVSGGDTSFDISWGEPTTPNGVISYYTVYIRHYSSHTTAFATNVTGGLMYGNNDQRLAPEVPYNVSVRAATVAGVGDEVYVINFTREGTPPMVENFNFTRINDTAINVTWKRLTLVEAKGFFNYTITLSPGGERRREMRQMTVPSTQSSITFTNLISHYDYSVTISAVTGAGSGPIGIIVVPAAGPNIPVVVAMVIIGMLLIAILVVVIIILVLLLLRNKRVKGVMTVQENPVALQSLNSPNVKSKEEEGGVEATMVASPINNIEENSERWMPVPVKEFALHAGKLHDNRDLGFEDEYKSLQNVSTGSYQCSKLPHNIPKNRFDNVFPFDSSRVELTPFPNNPGSDYINASYINGYKREKAYIAAQGPLVNTVGDFWRMTWEFQLPTIVMLTDLIERGVDKCTQYWPRNLNETIDVGNDLKVTLVEQQQFVDYKMKKMLLVNTSKSESGRLDVTHYHFLAWPDHGVPADKTVMLAFIRRVRQIHPPEGPPLIVHCSAGVGRTGTFITLDTMLQRLDKKEESLNIYEFLVNMRKSRVLMVQTEAQYVYIHDSLAEYITCGDTSMSTKLLKIKMDELSAVTDHVSGYERQYKLLNQVSRKAVEGHCADGLSKQNVTKNRYKERLDVMPYDMTRVRLKTTSGVGDYINASYVDGYKHRGAFLATQAPMDDTIEDLWRMIWEQWSSSMVILCDFEEDGESTCSRFWPEKVDETVTYGKMIVKLLSVEERVQYTVRKIMLSQDSTYVNMAPGGADHIVVTQFHYAKWQQNENPKDASPLLKLMDQLLHNQMKTGNKAITVMCNDGCGRTGSFLCIYSVLERIKIEGVADPFQYIKGARFLRPGLVQNPKQYEFCHDVILEYIESFDAYHNF